MDKILIIEDRAQFRRLMVNILKGKEFIIQEAGNADEGFKAIRGDSFQCILLERLLKGNAGLRMLHELKSNLIESISLDYSAYIYLSRDEIDARTGREVLLRRVRAAIGLRRLREKQVKLSMRMN